MILVNRVFIKLFRAPHCFNHRIHIGQRYHIDSPAEFFAEMFMDTAFYIVDYLRTLVAGKSRAQLLEIVLKQCIGILVYIENLTVYIYGKSLFHCSFSVGLFSRWFTV